jgi:hypothetical protein
VPFDQPHDPSLVPPPARIWAGAGVPPELTGHVVETGRALYFRRERPDRVLWALGTLCLAGLCGGVAGAMGWVLLVSALGMSAHAQLAAVGVALLFLGASIACGAVGWRLRHPWTRVDAGGVSTLPLFPVRRSDRLVVAGRMGFGTVLTVDGAPILQLDAADLDPDADAAGRRRRTGWTVRGVTWLASRIAERGGMALDDRRDLEAWARWASFPEVRTRVAWNREIASNIAAFPELHAMDARPFAHATSDEGRVVEVGGTQVVLGADALMVRTQGADQRFRWRDMQDARIVFESDGGPLVRARMDLLVAERPQTILCVTFRARGSHARAAGLRWLLHEVGQRLAAGQERARASDGRDPVSDGEASR